MHVAIITAGGAGMFCGSCMHDNTWARALIGHGVEVSLIPTYTPIRVDEKNVSAGPVFFGGINVYLESQWGFWQKLPRGLTRWLDSPWVINVASRFAVSNDATKLGRLTLAMLEGDAGPNRREVDELADHLVRLSPDVVCFSNALLVGALRHLKQRFSGRVYCTLQGDDIFLDSLPEPYRTQATDMMSERAQQFDGFLVHSAYYRDFMAQRLRLPADRFHIIPLGIDLAGHDGQPGPRGNARPTIGFFARICPEKGLHRLIDAFRILRGRMPDARLLAGGYLGARDQRYFQELSQSARDLGDSFTYIGSPVTHAEKVAFLKSLDVFSVPTDYHEPKGLPVLEALANGVPVVQPRHGAFPELIEATGGGLLVEPGNAVALADALEELLRDDARRTELGRIGQTAVREKYNPQALAEATRRVFTGELIPA